MGQDEFKRKPVSVPYNFIRLPKQVIPAEFYEGNYEDITNRFSIKFILPHIAPAYHLTLT